MSNLWPRIEPLLARVEKPARYIGMERGAVRPAWEPGQVAFLLIYPDTYEIGLPNQGLQILYEILNERPDALAERAYAPWTDMNATLRSNGLPLFSVDTHRSAGDFDVLAFNLSAELVYTNVLECVDLAGVPVRNEDRTPEHPIVIAGGHCAYNPEPLAEYVDAFVMGDGEEVISEVAEVIGAWKRGGRATRDAVLRELATIEGVYVPAMYEVDYEGQFIREVRPRFDDVPAKVDKRTVADLAEWPYPKQQLVPLVEVVHDRLNVEIFRGCTRGCRFCQAGMITRPVRERPEEQVRTMVQEGLRRTGYDEVALTSLSSADFSGIENVVADLVTEQTGTGGVSVSLPSLRVDAFSVGIASQIQKVRRTGLTFAPEAGSWRLRQVINKLIVEDDLYSAVDAAYSQGWRRVKLYFLTGLPTEMDDDTLGVAALAKNVVDIGRRYTKQASCTVSVGGFVPKPHTPFQWFGQNGVDELRRKITLLRDACKGTRAQVKWHDPAATFAEGIASRGDRRVGRVIERVACGWHVPGVERALRARPLDGCHARRRTRRRLVRDPAPHDRRDPSLGPHHCRPAHGLPLAGLASGPGRARAPRLPVDTVLRLWGVHRLRARACGGLAGPSGRRQPGHWPGPDRRRCRTRALPRCDAGRVDDEAVGFLVIRGDTGFPVRLRYTKRGKIRWISHRDVARALERAFRITELPLAFTEGFSPRPKVSFGLALSTGHESDAEYLDLEFAREFDLDKLPELLTEALPDGMEVTSAQRLVERAPALQEVVSAVEWRVEVVHGDGAPVAAGELRSHIDIALAASELPTKRHRKGREVTEDVRPVIRWIDVIDRPTGSEANTEVRMELSTQPRSAKPGEILAAIARVSGAPGDLVEASTLRLHQWIERDGTRCEPHDADTRPRAPVAHAS